MFFLCTVYYERSLYYVEFESSSLRIILYQSYSPRFESCILSLFLLGGAIPPPPEQLFQHYSKTRKDFLFKLGDFFIDQWVTIGTIKLEERPFHVAMAIAQIKGVRK